jgi:hypothetical protein
MNAGGTVDYDLPTRTVRSTNIVGFMAAPLLHEILTELLTDFRNVESAADGDCALIAAQCKGIVEGAFARRGVRGEEL